MLTKPSCGALRTLSRKAHRRRVLLIVLGLVAVAFVFLFRACKANSDRGGQKYAEPFRIAGNLYYVRANDVASFLITSPQGHVLIDGGYPGTPPMIIASIRKLGFDIRDVKVLLNSEPHLDHAGGLAELQKASGAELWASDASAASIESLPVDIWVWSHARLCGRYRKFAARDTATDPVAPFIDPAGYRAYIDSGEARIRRGEVHQAHSL